jgi:hypothetical protein
MLKPFYIFTNFLFNIYYRKSKIRFDGLLKSKKLQGAVLMCANYMAPIIAVWTI